MKSVCRYPKCCGGLQVVARAGRFSSGISRPDALVWLSIKVAYLGLDSSDFSKKDVDKKVGYVRQQYNETVKEDHKIELGCRQGDDNVKQMLLA